MRVHALCTPPTASLYAPRERHALLAVGPRHSTQPSIRGIRCQQRPVWLPVAPGRRVVLSFDGRPNRQEQRRPTRTAVRPRRAQREGRAGRQAGRERASVPGQSHCCCRRRRRRALGRESRAQSLKQSRCRADPLWARIITCRKRAAATWLILPVVICLSQRLSHACVSTYRHKVKPRMAH